MAAATLLSGKITRPATEPTLITCPERLSIMSPSTAWIAYVTPLTFTSIIRSHPST